MIFSCADPVPVRPAPILRQCVQPDRCAPAHPRVPHQGLPHALEPPLGMGAAPGDGEGVGFLQEWMKTCRRLRLKADKNKVIYNNQCCITFLLCYQ